MQALAAGGLAERDHTERFQALAHLASRLYDGREFDLRSRIEVENQPARHFGFPGLAIPRVQFQRTNLGDGREAFDAVDLQIGLLVTEDRDQFEQFRRAGHCVALEELLAADPVRRTDDGARPPLMCSISQGPTVSK